MFGISGRRVGEEEAVRQGVLDGHRSAAGWLYALDILLRPDIATTPLAGL
jgi:hypothetical protein